MKSEIPSSRFAALLAVPVALALIVEEVPRFVFASCSYYCQQAVFSVTAEPATIALNETSLLTGRNYSEPLCNCNWQIDSQPGGWQVVAGSNCTATLKPIGTYGNKGTIVVRCTSGQSCSKTVSVEAGVSTFRVQGSLNGGTSWTSNNLTIQGKPGEYVDVALRVAMTVTNALSQGWSYSVKHDKAAIIAGGGALDLLSVTTTGTHTDTVQDDDPPDFEATDIRQDAAMAVLGFAQGVAIDFDPTAFKLDTVLNFITVGACYRLRVPAAGSYQASFFLTGDIGDGQPPILSLITQPAGNNYPHLRGLTLTVYSHSSYTTPPGNCNATWATAADGLPGPSPPQGGAGGGGGGGGLLAPALTRRLPPVVVPEGESRDARITPDGRFVAFASRAPNLGFNPGNSFLHIYRFDRSDNSLLHVSKDTDGAAAAQDCFHPSISDDGTKIAFASFAMLDSAKDHQSLCDIYVRNLTVGQTRLLSVEPPPSGNAPQMDPSLLPGISGNGAFVLFTSQATNLDPQFSSANDVVYRVATLAGTPEFVSFVPDITDPEQPFDGDAATGDIPNEEPPVLTQDEIRGSTVGSVLDAGGDAGVFQARATEESVDPHVFLRDFTTGSPRTLAASESSGELFAKRPTISRDTSRLAYTFRGDDPSQREEIHFEDVMNGGSGFSIDVTLGGTTGSSVNGDSSLPMLSRDGRFITFTSTATNLVRAATGNAPDDNDAPDVFIANLEGGPWGVRRESVDSAGAETEDEKLSRNSDLAIVAGRSVVVFESDASNLIASDGNEVRDIFERTDDASNLVGFVRGDVDSNGTIDITDAVNTLGFLFLGMAEPACSDAADADDDGAISITDAIRILGFLFQGTGALPPPGPIQLNQANYLPSHCGLDPTPEDDLSCVTNSEQKCR
jgi:Tol biopolymer transport system component